MKEETNKEEGAIKRIEGYLHRVVPIKDASGKVISYTLKRILCEFKIRDVIQVIVGAALMAMPVSLTEEAWTLGEQLPDKNILYIALASLALISVFVYYNFYNMTFKGYVYHFIYRVIGTYLISLLVVALILIILDKLPAQENPVLAIKSIIIVAFPAALGGTLSDLIK